MRNSIFSRRNRRTSNTRNKTSRFVVEAVEQRLFCDGSFATAVSLGAPIGLITKFDHVDGVSNKHDFFKITTPIAGRLRVSLSNITGGDPDLFLYNAASSGHQIGLSTNGGTTPELIDQASVPAGTYYIEARHSSGGTSNYQLGVQTDYAGQTTSTARAVGSISTTEKVFKDFIGTSDNSDYYKFSTTSNTMIKLKLDGLSNDATLSLYDSGGNLLKSSPQSGTTPDVIYHGTAAGTYYARVTEVGTLTTNYQLHLSTQAVPSDGGGNTLATATDLGTLGSKTLSAWIVNKFDTDDYYKIKVAHPGSIGVILSGLSADLDLQLLNSSGTVVASSTSGGLTTDSVLFSESIGGTFYIRIFAGDGAHINSSPYTLQINAPVDAGGNTLATATKLTLVGGATAANGFVGVNDPSDWYKVVLPFGDYHVTLSGLSADADLKFYLSNGSQFASSAHSGTTSETINLVNMAGGTYYFQVFSFGSANTNYHLDLSVT